MEEIFHKKSDQTLMIMLGGDTIITASGHFAKYLSRKDTLKIKQKSQNECDTDHFLKRNFTLALALFFSSVHSDAKIVESHVFHFFDVINVSSVKDDFILKQRIH